MKRMKKVLLPLAGVAMASQANAAVVLTSVTDALDDTSAAIAGIAASVITAAVTVGAIKWGGAWAKGVFKTWFR